MSWITGHVLCISYCLLIFEINDYFFLTDIALKFLKMKNNISNCCCSLWPIEVFVLKEKLFLENFHMILIWDRWCFCRLKIQTLMWIVNRYIFFKFLKFHCDILFSLKIRRWKKYINRSVSGEVIEYHFPSGWWNNIPRSL